MIQWSTDALTLYLFLVTVGDHEGLSYYRDESINKYLNFSSSSDVKSCREKLKLNNMISYLDGLYQVLGLGSACANRFTKDATHKNSVQLHFIFHIPNFVRILCNCTIAGKISHIRNINYRFFCPYIFL